MDVDHSFFIERYLNSLNERSRVERGRISYGFDWVVGNLCQAKGWRPYKLPYHRDEDTPQPKAEQEFGVDFAFINGDVLIILALKKDRLTYANWTKKGFCDDLSMAVRQDWANPDFSEITTLKVILVYNKDEDNGGLKLFQQFKDNLEASTGGRKLEIDRWNLTKLVSEVEKHLLSPELLPKGFSPELSVVSSLLQSVQYGSYGWTQHLMPRWIAILTKLFGENGDDERSIDVAPVVLLILSNSQLLQSTSAVGWFDLCEQVMLKLWKLYDVHKKTDIFKKVATIWGNLYIVRLVIFYQEWSEKFQQRYPISMATIGESELAPVVATHRAYWHLSRIGIMYLSGGILFRDQTEEIPELAQSVEKLGLECIVGLIENEPAIFRPYIDLHHIEIFLSWLILWLNGDLNLLLTWLNNLENRLYLRRFGKGGSFLEFGNSSYSYFRSIVSGLDETEEERNEHFSSYLFLMLLELCCALPDDIAPNYLKRIYDRIIRPVDSEGKVISKMKRMDLVGWVPPKDWRSRILAEHVSSGTGLSLSSFVDKFGRDVETDGEVVKRRILENVRHETEQFESIQEPTLPLEIYILACIRHRSPLPPYFWREFLQRFFEKNNPNDHAESGAT